MKKMFLAVCLMIGSSVCYGNEWVPYTPAPAPVQVVVQQYPVIQPVPVVVPVMVPYVPVVTYDSVMVEYKQWCLFKRYEIINVPRVVYVPAKY